MTTGILPANFLCQAGAADLVTETEETIRWLEMPDAWVVVLLILPLLVVFVGFFYKREKPVGNPRWRWALGALRLLVVALALLMLARPVRQKTTYERRDSTLVLLVDDSLSQDIKDKYSEREIPKSLAELFRTQADIVEGTTRYDLVRRLVRDEKLGFITYGDIFKAVSECLSCHSCAIHSHNFIIYIETASISRGSGVDPAYNGISFASDLKSIERS